MFGEGLLKVLLCPVSRNLLKYDRVTSELVCCTSDLAYLIRGTIAGILASKSRTLKESGSA